MKLRLQFFGGIGKSVSSNNESYLRFDNIPSGRFEFGGEFTKQWDFIYDKTNNMDLIDNMDSDVQWSFKKWTEGWLMEGQQYEGWDNMQDNERQWTQDFDDIIDQSVIKENIQVVRRSTQELIQSALNDAGVSLDFSGDVESNLKALNKIKNMSVISKGNISTSLAKEGLLINVGSSDKPIEYKINVPKSIKGAGMWVGDTSINGWGDRQLEFMMNRDLAYNIGKATYDENRKCYVVELTVAGRLQHDYGTKGRLTERI